MDCANGIIRTRQIVEGFSALIRLQMGRITLFV